MSRWPASAAHLPLGDKFLVDAMMALRDTWAENVRDANARRRGARRLTSDQSRDLTVMADLATDYVAGETFHAERYGLAVA